MKIFINSLLTFLEKYPLKVTSSLHLDFLYGMDLFNVSTECLQSPGFIAT